MFGQGGVFTLGALSFGVAALAVWVMGIETKGLALESLAAKAAPEASPEYRGVAVDDVR